MKTKLKIIALILLIVLVGIQFIPTKRNQTIEVFPTNFERVYKVPNNIKQLLQTSCYDCHSNNTAYPWYNKIQPVSWFMERHIKEGKAELNFSEFGNYSKRRQKNKLKSIISQIEKEEMPLSSYTLIHRNAKLSDEEKIKLIEWLTALRDKF